jgi:hypothetical protein
MHCEILQQKRHKKCNVFRRSWRSSVREKHFTGPSMSVTFFLGIRQRAWPGVIVGTHSCNNGNTVVWTLFQQGEQRQLLECTVATIGTEVTVETHCCNNENRGHCLGFEVLMAVKMTCSELSRCANSRLKMEAVCFSETLVIYIGVHTASQPRRTPSRSMLTQNNDLGSHYCNNDLGYHCCLQHHCCICYSFRVRVI